MRCWLISRSRAGNISTTADNGKWVYPACKRTASDAGADKDSVCNHTRLEAVRYLLTVPRAEFRLLAEPDSQPAILDGYLRQLPHDETVIEFTGNTMSDLAIAVIAGFNWLNHCAGLAGADRRKFSGTLNHFRKFACISAAMVGDEGRQGALRPTVAGAAGAAAVPVSGLGGLWPAGERDRGGTRRAAGLVLLRVEQRHGRIHHHLDQAGAVMRQAVLERAREFG